jgi:hypothetical protein
MESPMILMLEKAFAMHQVSQRDLEVVLKHGRQD